MKIAWLRETVASYMRKESHRRLPDETGGILLGYWGNDNEVVVTEAVGPGPAAAHGRDRFAPDYDFHDAEVARVFRQSSGAITYLGDWHSHGDAPVYLSLKDRRTLHDIASDPGSRAPRALMAVLGKSPQWKLAVWVYTARPFAPLTYPWCPEQCSVRAFD